MGAIILTERNIQPNILNITEKGLYDLIIIRNGGETTLRIIDELLIKPKNANQLSKKLKLDYKTVLYHLDIICKYDYIIKQKFENHYSYFPSDRLIKNLREYNIIKESLKK